MDWTTIGLIIATIGLIASALALIQMGMWVERINNRAREQMLEMTIQELHDLEDNLK